MKSSFDEQGDMSSFHLAAQFTLTISSVILLIVSLICKELEVLYNIVLSLTLLYIAYNNYKIFKKKYMTIIPIVVSLLLLLTMVI